MSSKGSGLSDIILISTWPGPSRDTETVFKAPSRIAYASENNSRVTTNRWGYQVEPGMLSYSWTKLLLDQGTPLTQYDDRTLETASQTGILKLPEGKTAVDVVADYLSEVYQHILKTISKNITEDDLRISFGSLSLPFGLIEHWMLQGLRLNGLDLGKVPHGQWTRYF